MYEEEALAGGNWTDEVVRVGRRVHRSRGPNSNFAATLLGELEHLGIPFAPRYLGRDDKGRDVFTYFDGSTKCATYTHFSPVQSISATLPKPGARPFEPAREAFRHGIPASRSFGVSSATADRRPVIGVESTGVA